MVIGGIAVIARGVRRMTTDIDATVRGDQADIGSLVRSQSLIPRFAFRPGPRHKQIFGLARVRRSRTARSALHCPWLIGVIASAS
jgi:hypothetical protein